MYNENGLRVQKTATSTGVTNYTLHGKNIVHMTQGSNELHFFYDAQDRPSIVDYNGSKYGYVYNLQGDVVAIVDSKGATVVQYRYDAWGKPISTTGSMASTLGVMNPFRYRGYVYDQETGLYYICSRYYSPEVGRWINTDSVIAKVGGSVQGYNLVAYCFNNPANMSDNSGYWPQWIKDAANWVNSSIVQPVADFFQPPNQYN